MVCPNCKSTKIIAVQDQHFCINCGQVVPEEHVDTPAGAPKVAVQANGLPEGVKILPVAPGTAPLEVKADAPAKPKVSRATVAAPDLDVTPIVKSRPRIGTDAQEKAKKRKPGRPKAGRLDVPKVIASVAPSTGAPEASEGTQSAASAPELAPVVVSAPLPVAPAITGSTTAARVTAPVPAPLTGSHRPRRMNDLSPRRSAPKASHTSAEPTPEVAKEATAAKATNLPGRPMDIAPIRSAAPSATPANTMPAPEAQAEPAPAKPSKKGKAHAHKVEVPTLHYGPVWRFVLRARFHPRWLMFGALGSVALGVAGAYGAWVYLQNGVGGLSNALTQSSPQVLAEAALLGLVYYIGRSLGQSAITFGIAREADQRPVTLSRMFGVAVNTFNRRLGLDIMFGLGEVALVAAAVALFVSGGSSWPIHQNAQTALVFGAYLGILYLFSALTISRGLAGVNVSLTTHNPFTAARYGWSLFAHRLELIGPRFGAFVLELVLALPLLAIAVAMIIATPAPWHIEAVIATGVVAWLAGTMVGVGTAAWWTMLYRQLVLADRPAAALSLLSSRQPEDARRGPLALLVAVSTLIIAASLLIPWADGLF